MEYINDEIGGRIKEALRHARILQSGIAKQLGVTQPTVTAWIQGRNQPPVQALIAIAGICNVSLDWLLTGKGIMAVGEPGQEYQVTNIHRKLSPDEEELLQLLEAVPGARETMEVFLQLPERKQKIYLGKMLEDLEKIEGEK